MKARVTVTYDFVFSDEHVDSAEVLAENALDTVKGWVEDGHVEYMMGSPSEIKVEVY